MIAKKLKIKTIRKLPLSEVTAYAKQKREYQIQLQQTLLDNPELINFTIKPGSK